MKFHNLNLIKQNRIDIKIFTNDFLNINNETLTNIRKRKIINLFID